MVINPSIFKSYDLRGIYPTDFNEKIAANIAKAYVTYLNPKKVVVGRDVRSSGESIKDAVIKAFLEFGVDVIDVGLVSTDMFYFAVGSSDVDGGITISASHNPKEWNGMNFCKKNAEPMSLATGLNEIKTIVENDSYKKHLDRNGALTKKDILDEFINKCMSFIDSKNIKTQKIVANANFGIDVIILKRIIEKYNLPLTLVPLNGEPDGSFPKGSPNPLLPENRGEFVELVKKEKANFGVSWDGDGDRCFFADENGEFIESYYIIAVLAKEILKKNPCAKVLIDPRLVWATSEEIEKSGGKAIVCKPGMTIIADRMKQEDAIFAGEMSGHFYFRDNYYRDNGIVPLLLILEMTSKYNTPLSSLANPYITKYHITGELNFETENKDKIIEEAKNKYSDGKQEFIDGLSVEYEDWRFNLRKSNTEPLLRLNLEAKSKEVMEQKKKEVVDLIENLK